MDNLQQARIALAQAQACLLAPNSRRLAESARRLEDVVGLLAELRPSATVRAGLEAFRLELTRAHRLMRSGAAFYEGLSQTLFAPDYAHDGRLATPAGQLTPNLSIEG
jgi:hypothetical protein